MHGGAIQNSRAGTNSAARSGTIHNNSGTEDNSGRILNVKTNIGINEAGTMNKKDGADIMNSKVSANEMTR